MADQLQKHRASLWRDVYLKTDKRQWGCQVGTECVAQCVPHPGGHASGGKAGNVVLKVDPPDANYIHLVCWVVQGTEKKGEKLN